jgi:hypothetical protein
LAKLPHFAKKRLRKKIELQICPKFVTQHHIHLKREFFGCFICIIRESNTGPIEAEGTEVLSMATMDFTTKPMMLFSCDLIGRK